jgi:NADH pyrophosphatase NudC (nudix superfamily)
MNSYLILNRNYELADYLLSVRDVKQRQILTKYRLSDHNLAVETGRHRLTWLPREHRMCGHCQAEKVETEEHLLIHCKKYDILRQIYFTKLQSIFRILQTWNMRTKMQFFLIKVLLLPWQHNMSCNVIT